MTELEIIQMFEEVNAQIRENLKKLEGMIDVSEQTLEKLKDAVMPNIPQENV